MISSTFSERALREHETTTNHTVKANRKTLESQINTKN